MLIEYKIKFENDGLTITQRVEPGASRTQPAKQSVFSGVTHSKHLSRSFAASVGGGPGDETGTGGGPGDETGTGGGPGDETGTGGGPGSGPVTILGPFIMGGLNPRDRGN